MLRKAMLTVAAIATLGTAALAPTAASATYWHHKHWHGGYHFNSYGYHLPSYGYGCFRKKWVQGYYGWRLVRVNVCAY